MHGNKFPERAARRETRAAVVMCGRCGGAGGWHGLVHVRGGNGGGSNKPCPRLAELADLRAAVVAAMCEAAGQPNATTLFGERLGVIADAAIDAVHAWTTDERNGR